MSASSLAHIRPLAEASAIAPWREFVSQDTDHPRQLSDRVWLGQLYASPTRADWQTDWNDDKAIDFTEWLCASLP